MNHGEHMDHIKSCVSAEDEDQEKARDEFCKLCHYISIDKDGGDKSFEELRDLMESFTEEREAQNRLFYMALPPNVYVPVSEQLKRCCKSKEGVSRIIVEKPFGRDLESSVELHKKLAPNWSENEIFRIDHYLGKEMVKNILVLRFGNPMFGAVWSCDCIDNIQISMTEAIGTEGRGGYFDDVGILRDVMQNHLTQMLALIAMERPGSFSAEDMRQEKARVLRLVPPLEMKNTILGQYGKPRGGEKPGYKDDESVPKKSQCATFCASVAYVKNARWEGVPFILKAGKATGESKTEIRIQLKDTTAAMLEHTMHNELIIQIQPKEGVRLKMNAKDPGLELKTVATELDLTYKGIVEDPDLPEAYEALLLDALRGDFSLSVREDELEASWKIFTPLLHHLESTKDIVPEEYPYGSDGPESLKKFVESYQYLTEKR